mmetsp:Transcript_70290/g.164631  ORF Transcript_70290/g.164631 Transcript_70290/m.164631 type:complete len:405 (+) Transcript_70290:519-1733(+)
MPVHALPTGLRRSARDLDEDSLRSLPCIAMRLGQKRLNVLHRKKTIAVLIGIVEDKMDGRLQLRVTQVDAGSHELGPVDCIFVLAEVHGHRSTLGLLLLVAATDELSDQDRVLEHAGALVIKLFEHALEGRHLVWRPVLCYFEADKLVECISFAGGNQAVDQLEPLLHLCDRDAIRGKTHEGLPEAISGIHAPGPLLLQHLGHQALRVDRCSLHPFPVRSRPGLPEIPCLLLVPTVLEVPGHLETEKFEKHTAAAENISLRRDFSTPDFRRHGRRRAHGAATLEIARLEDCGDTKVDDNDVRKLLEDVNRAHRLVRLGLDEAHLRLQSRHQHNILRLDVQVNDTVRMDVRHGREELLHNVSDPHLRDGLPRVPGIADVLVQLATRAMIRHQENPVLAVVEFQEF